MHCRRDHRQRVENKYQLDDPGYLLVLLLSVHSGDDLCLHEHCEHVAAKQEGLNGEQPSHLQVDEVVQSDHCQWLAYCIMVEEVCLAF